MPKPLKIVILGTRGVPASYGGFETFAEELGVRLVERGHDVSVACRRRFFERYQGPSSHRGIKVFAVPTIMHKYLETPVHALMSFLRLLFCRYDLVLLCNAANSPFAWIVRLLGIPLLINVDGIERKRAKWNALGRIWYLLGERCSVWFASRVVADAEVIAEYYRKNFSIEPSVIAYGATVVRKQPADTLREFSLNARKYILYVSRLEPENNALGVIQAYNMLQTDAPLVIVGDAPYADEYKQLLATRSVRAGSFYWLSVWRSLSRTPRELPYLYTSDRGRGDTPCTRRSNGLWESYYCKWDAGKS